MPQDGNQKKVGHLQWDIVRTYTDQTGKHPVILWIILLITNDGVSAILIMVIGLSRVQFGL